MVLQIQRSETLELTILVRGLATFLTIPVLKVFESSGRLDVFGFPVRLLQFLLSKMKMSVRLVLHFRWSSKVLARWIVVQPPRLGGLKVQRLRSPRLMKMVHESQMLILIVASHSIWEIVHRQKPRQLTVFFGSLRTCSLINQNRLHGYSQAHRCVAN